MVKKIICILTTFILVVGLVLGGAKKSFAYTDAEKAQAKAWLSAHGYSPDAGGASQAYEDYLNGKFDAELSLSSEYNTGTYEINTDAATAEQNMQSTTEKSTEVAEEDDEDSDEDNDATTKTEKDENQVAGNSQNIQDEATDNEGSLLETDAGNETIFSSDNENIENKEAIAIGSAKNSKDVSAMEQANREEKNRGALRVIGGSVVIMLIVEGYIAVFRRRKEIN